MNPNLLLIIDIIVAIGIYQFIDVWVEYFVSKYYKEKPVVYEVKSLKSHCDWVDKQLAEAQAEGWEIAGDILLKNENGHVGYTYFHIPLKRIKK